MLQSPPWTGIGHPVWVYILAEAKRFSLINQEKNINMIKMLNAVKSTKSNHEMLLKRIKENSEYILNLENLKIGIRDTNLWTTLERPAVFLIMLLKLLKESFLATRNDTATCLMTRTGLMWASVQMREIALYLMSFVILIATSGEALAARSPNNMLASGIFHRW